MPYQTNTLLSINIEAYKTTRVNYRVIELPLKGIFARIFLEDKKAIQVDYELASLRNICRNILKR